MSALNVLFTVDSEGNFLVNRPEAKKIKEFALLFDRDKGSEGDSDGKKKRIANAEIFMIYLICDVRSSIYNLPYDERLIEAKKISCINERWKVDKQWLEAIEKYKEFFELSSSGKGYAVAERAYYSFTRDTFEMQEELNACKGLLNDVIKRLKKINNKGEEDTILLNNLNDALSCMNEINKIQKDMIGNIKNFSSLDDMVKTLASKFVEEGGQLKIKVGGGQIGNREN